MDSNLTNYMHGYHCVERSVFKSIFQLWAIFLLHWKPRFVLYRVRNLNHDALEFKYFKLYAQQQRQNYLFERLFASVSLFSLYHIPLWWLLWRCIWHFEQRRTFNVIYYSITVSMKIMFFSFNLVLIYKSLQPTQTSFKKTDACFKALLV